ncbi:DUF3718 domain-containing protein [Lacimicrobium sp. SS2-24]|uniref:DUF3718 domain-containing protein n=1 Tax=Lacimicrobium sp. SS2-24 TaxID=2005569 RepID=UPI000B4BBC38|nr:DUF3718 domain-containing protein [Lacimicrobium sp. SS2-24]
MIKPLNLALTAALAATLSLPVAADIQQDLQNICTIVKNNDKSELRKKMRDVRQDYNLKLGDYYAGITCDNMSLIRHAMSNGAVDTGEYLIKSMTRSELSEPEADGQTLEKWAEANGHLKSPIGIALVDRLNTN